MKLFGTDGIRGIYGNGIDNSIAFKLGNALVKISKEEVPLIVVGRDTRNSGGELLSAFVSGVIEAGGKPINIGIMPTNAVSFFTSVTDAAYGVMISASHNAPEYNGLKVFDCYGTKICKKIEADIEDIINKENLIINPIIDLPYIKNAQSLYKKHLLNNLESLKDMTIAMDCCFGSAAYIAPQIFEMAGANVIPINNEYNGKYINYKCGATNPDCIINEEMHYKADIAFSFDGDADRLIVVEDGKLLNNNLIFYVIAKFLEGSGKLKGQCVGTIITNGGLENSLKKIGIKMHRSNVGDSEVFRKMMEVGAIFGGEDSGHYMLSEYNVTSDAIFNALFVAVIKKHIGSLSEYGKELQLMPRCSLNLPWKSENDILIEKYYAILKSKYPDMRIVIRKSGTEPLLRITAEDENNDNIEAVCLDINNLYEEIK